MSNNSLLTQSTLLATHCLPGLSKANYRPHVQSKMNACTSNLKNKTQDRYNSQPAPTSHVCTVLTYITHITHSTLHHITSHHTTHRTCTSHLPTSHHSNPLYITSHNSYHLHRRDRIRGTICFFLGIAMVLWRWCVFGLFLEGFGFLNLFGNFLPTVLTVGRQLPLIGPVLDLPVVGQAVDFIAGKSKGPKYGV